MRPRLALAGTLGQSDRACELSEGALVAEEAPILDLGALTPEETALSIMSEIVALRRGRPGGRLANARGRIHEVTGEVTA
jgi:xanthine dehydrogenase accessory factor